MIIVVRDTETPNFLSIANSRANEFFSVIITTKTTTEEDLMVTSFLICWEAHTNEKLAC